MTGSYLVPGGLFSFTWFIFTFLPLLLLFNVQINPIGILYIYLATFAFSLGGLPFNWRYALKQNRGNKEVALLKLNSSFIRYCFYVSIFLALMFSALQVISNGFGIAFFISNFIETSARYAALRGNDYIEYGIIGTLSIFFTYFSAILGAIISFFKTARKGKFFSFLLGIVPSLFAMLIQSSKLIFMVAIIFYLAAVLLMKILSNNHVLFKFSDLIKLFWISILLLPLIIIAFISREGYSNFDNISQALDLLLPAINSYLFGSLYAFSDFFSFYLGMESISKYSVEYYNLGYYSFKAVYDLFGGTKVFPPGFYSDNYDYKDILSTNVFTAFRGFIQDFGVLGSLVFSFFMGLFFHFFFYRLLVNKNIWLACSVFIMFIGFIGLSFLINIFTARYIFLISIMLYFILTVNSYFFYKPHLNK